MTYSGGCACTAVRYMLNCEPRFFYLCQCRDCQQATGCGHAPLLMFDAGKGKLAGEDDLRFYDKKGDSGGTISRGFCQHCGSPVLARLSAWPNAWLVYAGSLDDSSTLQPTRALWHQSAQHWDYLHEDIEILDGGL